MSIDFINIGLAFIEGIALIISPCILPILFIVLSGSLLGSKARPLGIIVGFIITFSAATLLSRSLLTYLHISTLQLQNISYVILLLLALFMMSNYLSEKFLLMTSSLSNVGNNLTSANNTQGGFWSGVLFGCLAGVIWTPCAGPILATVLVQIIIQQTHLNSILIVIAFAIGAGIPMLMIAFLGRSLVHQLKFLRNHTSIFRKLLGLLIIASVVFAYYSGELNLAQSSVTQTTQTSTPASNNKITTNKNLTLQNGLAQPYPAPAIAGITAWLNSEPLQLEQLKGKVVLIDFWAYSCINCIRTMPYLKNWYAEYKDKGLVIIGVHSPEFQFEADINNVKAAIAKFGITYPVALDNQFTTWRNYANRYWPAHYLIDKEGRVVYQHFGEGKYDVTENNIRYLLGVNTPVNITPDKATPVIPQTPETYLGYERADSFDSFESLKHDQIQEYHYPTTFKLNNWGIKGKWIVYPDKIVAQSADAAIQLHFNAKMVYAVMGSGNHQTIPVKVLLNQKLLTTDIATDVKEGTIDVNANRLYTLVKLSQPQTGLVELVATKPGLEIYTFTFGSE